jgi:hypothetical protein
MNRRVMVAAVGVIVVVGMTGCARSSKTAAAPAASPADTGYGLRAATVEFVPAAGQPPMGIPASAAPGDCYVQAVVPAQYDTVPERVVKKAASSRIEVVPAQMEEVEERVVVRPATKKIEVVPARTRTVTETVVVRPAYSVWKRSSELTAAERAQQKTEPRAGDILCLVEVPAETRTITREVIETPATTRQVEVPAEYATVKVQRVVTAAREVTIDVPAEYEEVPKQVLRTPAATEWRQVLCDTNASPRTLSAVQQSLRRAGFDPGRDDGRVDDKTLSALRAFQQSKGLPVDSDRYINVATVKALGVEP